MGADSSPLFLGVIFFGLSAPLLFTVGAMFLASRFPESAPTWAIIYLILGPFACAMWMSILSHLPTWVNDWKIRRAGGHVHSYFGRGFQKGISFQFAGLFGSLLSEGVFTYAAHRLNVIPNHLMLFFAVAPCFVFAPVLLVLLSRWIRRDDYATA